VDQGGYGKTNESTQKKVYVHSDGNFSLEKEHECGGKKEETLDGSRNESEMVSNRPSSSALIDPGYEHTGFSETVISDGSVVIAAITSCTNTSSPSVMVGAGLLAKKACQKGLKVSPLVKTSLAPGSRVVTDYLYKSGLQKYLDELGFQLVAYGCTTCIGNSGPLDERLETAIKEHHLVATSVLSGNRNFEARVHASVKANFLMSPPLVVAFAIAGRVNIDFEKEPLGFSSDGKGVYLKDIWPKEEEIEKIIKETISPSLFKTRYHIQDATDNWKQIETSKGINYKWEEKSTYIQNPPYLTHFSLEPKKPSELKGTSKKNLRLADIYFLLEWRK
jgi:aconitate hydratase